MGRHIKLTRDILHYFPGGQEAWVFVDHIVYLHGNGSGTTIRMENGFCIDVTERPADVLALIDRADAITVEQREARNDAP